MCTPAATARWGRRGTSFSAEPRASNAGVAARQFVVLENGFGLGVNFLATWQAWRDDPARPRRAALRLDRTASAAGGLVRRTRRRRNCGTSPRSSPRSGRSPIAGLHRCEFEQGRVVLTLALGDARALAPELRLGADALFLDGFAPDRNPEMWEPSLLRSLARLARRDCRVATWSTARARARRACGRGFRQLELAAGFASKRQMLVGRYAPRYVVRRHEPPDRVRGRAQRGRGRRRPGRGRLRARARATRLERPRDRFGAVRQRRVGAAMGADAPAVRRRRQPARALDARGRRVPRRVRSNASRRTACIAASRCGNATGSSSWSTRPRGNAGVRRSPRSGCRAEFVQWMDAEQATASPRRASRHGRACGGPTAAWSRPRTGSAHCSTHPSITFVQAPVGRGRAARRRLARARHARRKLVAHAPLVIVAAALDTPRLVASTVLPVQPVPGQVTFVRADALQSLQAGLGGDGTLLRAPDGRLAGRRDLRDVARRSERAARRTDGRAQQPRAAGAAAGASGGRARRRPLWRPALRRARSPAVRGRGGRRGGRPGTRAARRALRRPAAPRRLCTPRSPTARADSRSLRWPPN